MIVEEAPPPRLDPAGAGVDGSMERAETRALQAAPPRVSIVVPGLNEAESLPELCAGIVQHLEGRTSFEVIFIDDGSTDNTGRS